MRRWQRRDGAAAAGGAAVRRRSGGGRARLGPVIGALALLAGPGVVVTADRAGAADSVLFVDGFESGTTTAWTTSTSAGAQQDLVRTGAWAGRLSSTGSPSYLRKKLPSTTPEVRLTAAVNLVSQGRNPVSLLTLRGPTGAGVASLLVNAQGLLAVRNVAAGTTTVSATSLPRGSWHDVSLAVRGGSPGRVEVALDGVAVARLTADGPVVASPVGQVEVGDVVRSRTYRIAVDDVTAAGPDVAPPSTPTGLAPLVSRDASQVTLAWVPSKDNVAVTGYDVFRNDAPVASVGLHTVFSDGSVQPGSTHTYTVRARDAQGNVSAVSPPARVEVPLLPRVEEPAAAAPPVGAVMHAMTSAYDDDLRSRAIDGAVAAGLTWIRVGVPWTRLQPRRPTATDPGYDYAGAVAQLDRFVAQADAAGLDVHAVLNATPKWANGGKGAKHLPTDPADYQRVAQWAAARYQGTVRSWEVYNEPNLDLQTVATPEDYTRVLCAAHTGFHQGNETSLVVAGATAGNDWEWYQRMYAAGAKGCFDVLATHPYQAYSLPPDYPAQDTKRWWTDNIRLVRDVMVANGDQAVPVWFTEFGWSTHENYPGMLDRQIGVTYDQQAEYTVDMIRRTVEKYPYVERVVIYQVRDAQVGNIRNDNYGLYTLAMEPKPVATAVRDYLATSARAGTG